MLGCCYNKLLRSFSWHFEKWVYTFVWSTFNLKEQATGYSVTRWEGDITAFVVECSRWCGGSSDRSFMKGGITAFVVFLVHEQVYLSVTLHNKGEWQRYPVCGMCYIKEPLLYQWHSQPYGEWQLFGVSV